MGGDTFEVLGACLQLRGFICKSTRVRVARSTTKMLCVRYTHVEVANYVCNDMHSFALGANKPLAPLYTLLKLYGSNADAWELGLWES